MTTRNARSTTPRSRIALFSHGPSDSINLLKDKLLELGVSVVKVKRQGSSYVGRQGDLLVNYGASDMPESIIGQATVLNHPSALANATNKLRAFERMSAAGIQTVEFTNSRNIAQGWVDAGQMVYVRTRLQGHSGEGIVLGYQNPAGVGDAGDYTVEQSVRQAPLYTKAIMGNRREFRVHVMNGVITYVQQKRRRDGYRDDGHYSNLVRNHASGWIYATENAAINTAGQQAAVAAVAALGLDYGAVDIITNQQNAWVLEVNTAPGMSGTNLETYANNFIRVFRGEEIPATVITENSRNANTASTNTTQAATTQRATAQPQQAPVEAPVSTASTARSSVPPLTPPAGRRDSERNAQTPANGGYYWLTVNGEETIGRFDGDNNHFDIIGWEVPVEAADATVGAHIVR